METSAAINNLETILKLTSKSQLKRNANLEELVPSLIQNLILFSNAGNVGDEYGLDTKTINNLIKYNAKITKLKRWAGDDAPAVKNVLDELLQNFAAYIVVRTCKREIVDRAAAEVIGELTERKEGEYIGE